MKKTTYTRIKDARLFYVAEYNNGFPSMLLSPKGTPLKNLSDVRDFDVRFKKLCNASTPLKNLSVRFRRVE